MSEFWNDFQKYLGVQIPSIVVEILIGNGYDDSLSLIGMCMEEIVKIEEFSNEKLSHLWKKSPQYFEVVTFAFLPGHKKLLLVLGEKAEGYKTLIKPPATKACNSNLEDAMSNSTVIMQELVNSLKSNLNVSSTNHRYSKPLQWFSSYVFMLGGRNLYEVLSKNLPIPQLPTVGM